MVLIPLCGVLVGWRGMKGPGKGRFTSEAPPKMLRQHIINIQPPRSNSSEQVELGPGTPLKVRIDERDVDSLVTKCCFMRVVGCDTGTFSYLLRYEKTSF